MDPDFGPLSVLYCWQSVVLAVGVSTGTHGVKALVDFQLGGKGARKSQVFFQSIFLPATPIVLGALIGAFIPLWPEPLTAYIAANALTGIKAKLVLAGYGAAVGQFADYAWSRYSSLLEGVKAKNAAAREAEAVATAAVLAVNPAATPAELANTLPSTPPVPPTIPPVA
jgi:hypothetical protein